MKQNMSISLRSSIIILFCTITLNVSAQNVFSVKGNKCYLNGEVFRSIGLRCSNALLSDESTDDLIKHLDEYREYGLNTISVYFMGSRYSNIYGFNKDASLNETYAGRMARIIAECDSRSMVVLVGILYWGSGMHDNSNAYYSGWGQKEINEAMKNVILWLERNKFRNVFIDPDNEGMAERGANFDIRSMSCEARKINPSIPVAYNGRGDVHDCADLTIHFGKKMADKPYIQTEGTPDEYWGEYSKEKNLEHYINVGIYTPTKKQQQLNETTLLLDQGHGYLFSSTWLQNVPPAYNAGGEGTPCDPGIKWWLDFVKEKYMKTASSGSLK